MAGKENDYGIKVGDRIDYHHHSQTFRGVVLKLQRRVAQIARANKNYKPTGRTSIVDYRAIFAVNGRPWKVPSHLVINEKKNPL